MNSIKDKDKSSSYNGGMRPRVICQAEIIDFTEDKDPILKFDNNTIDLSLIHI